jgi:hypothetical protein
LLPMVNFLSDVYDNKKKKKKKKKEKKKTTSILLFYIFHTLIVWSLCFTTNTLCPSLHFELRLCIHSRIFLKNCLILSFKKVFGRYQHLIEKYYVSCAQMTKDGLISAIRFWFKVDHCFTSMSSDGLVYYLIFKFRLIVVGFLFIELILYT